MFFRRKNEFIAFGASKNGLFKPLSFRFVRNKTVEVMLYPSSAMLYNLHSYNDTDHNRIIGVGGGEHYVYVTWRPSGEVGCKHGNKISIYLETANDLIYVTDIQVSKPVKITLNIGNPETGDDIALLSIRKGNRVIKCHARTNGLNPIIWKWPRLAKVHKGKAIMLGLKVLA